MRRGRIYRRSWNVRTTVGGRLKPLVSILTPSIPTRASMLEECKRSVESQTERRFEHLWKIDEERQGCARTMNHLAAQARGRYLLPLADDDLLLPGALRVLLSHARDGDIVYAPPMVWGNGDLHFFGTPPKIPSFALIPTKLWNDLGGYDETAYREEDRKLWIKALNEGATF